MAHAMEVAFVPSLNRLSPATEVLQDELLRLAVQTPEFRGTTPSRLYPGF